MNIHQQAQTIPQNGGENVHRSHDHPDPAKDTNDWRFDLLLIVVVWGSIALGLYLGSLLPMKDGMTYSGFAVAFLLGAFAEWISYRDAEARQSTNAKPK